MNRKKIIEIAEKQFQVNNTIFANAYSFICKWLQVLFYAGDENEPAHVHVEKGGGTAKIWLEPTLNAKYFYSFKNQEKKT